MNSDEFLKSSDLRIGYIKRIGQPWRPVVYSAVEGMAVFEGCIILGTVEEMERTTETVRRQPLLLSDPDAEPEGIAIKGAQFRWPGRKCFYEIDPALPNQQRVHDAIAHWEQHTAFRFAKRTSEPNYIRFRPGNGCSSSVGMQGNRQFITLGGGCSTGNTIHEIGHAVGLWHEQSRGDRDSFIEILWQNIDPLARHNFNQHVDDGVDLGSYDFGSIDIEVSPADLAGQSEIALLDDSLNPAFQVPLVESTLTRLVSAGIYRLQVNAGVPLIEKHRSRPRNVNQVLPLPWRVNVA